MIERGAVLTAIGASHTTPLQPSSYRSPIPDPQQLDIDHLPLRTHTPIHELKEPHSNTTVSNSFCSLWRRSSDSCYPDDDSLPGLEDSDDDCTTISSCSSGARSRSLPRAQVSFAPVLVTEVRTRPRTKPQDVSVLFYSCEETQRFRQEYRLERMEATEQEPEETSTKHVTLNHSTTSNIDDTTALIAHRISRVVVKHEDTRETFIDKELDYGLPLMLADNGEVSHASEAFFDNDRFWSGQITWY